MFVTSTDANLLKTVGLKWVDGNENVPAELGDNGVIVLDRYAKDHSLTVGSPLQLKTPTGKVVHLQVEGIADPPKGGSPFGELTVSTAVFDASFANHDNELTLLNIEGGPTDANTARLKQAVAAFPDAKVQTRDEFKDSQLGDLTRR